LTLKFAVLCSAINTKMLNPNYPIMVTPDAHPDSFPDTEPFDFNSATYFLPMMSLLGVAISSIFVGQLSDKVGRKIVILVMAIVSGFGSIAKYYTRDTFWAFAITNLVFGFFLGNLPVAMAYVGDVFTSKTEKQNQLGVIVGIFVMGNAGGGIIAILMAESGLFSPLWVGAGLMFVSSILVAKLLINPGDIRLEPIGKGLLKDMEEAEVRPTELNKPAMWNIVLGALADNIGSTALFPLCLSPLAIEQYFVQFFEADQEPIMSLIGYQWLSVCVAIMVVPSTLITPHVFAKIGVAGTCVVGNAFTGLLTIALLLIGNGPATQAAFAGFVVVLYAGFPITVFSQLTTGPMLDVLAPNDKIGFVQGLNNSAMNFGMALSPFIFGMLADATTTNTAIWTGIGVSFAAALINTPLMFRKEFGRPETKPPSYQRILPGDDEELAQKFLDGEYIPQEQVWELNRRRGLEKKPFLLPTVKPYEEDKEKLEEVFAHVEENLRFQMDLEDRILSELENPESDKSIEDLCEFANLAVHGFDPDVVNEQTAQMGQWIGDYLKGKIASSNDGLANYPVFIRSIILPQLTQATCILIL
jgi:MFS family permease